jgi:cyclase
MGLHQKDGRLQEIGKNVFALVWADDDSVYGGFGANQGFVILEDSVLVFDTGISARHARLLNKSVRSVTDKKIRFVVNSHDHSDHTFGNSFFLDKYSKTGIDAISHDLCASQLERLGKKRMKGYKRIPKLKRVLDPLYIALPTITYSNLGFHIQIEGTEFVFAHPPTGAHTMGDTFLSLPRARVLFAGDIVWNHFLPNLEDANLEGWISTLEDLDMATYAKCLPGHGEICGPKEIREFLEYLKAVKENLFLLEAHGKTNDVEEQKHCFEISGTENWRLRSIIEYNVNALFHSKE